MKVLVTGGAGYIGSVLVDRLISQGHLVNVIDDLSNGYSENIHKDAKFFQGSILDTDLLNKALEQTEVVLHLGAKIRVEEGESTIAESTEMFFFLALTFTSFIQWESFLIF